MDMSNVPVAHRHTCADRPVAFAAIPLRNYVVIGILAVSSWGMIGFLISRF